MRAEVSAVTLDRAAAAKLVPVRDPEGHKGTFGTLICVAGSLEYAGAALLCASAAARGGAGLVALAVPRSLQPVVAGRVPEAITIPLPETPDGKDIVGGLASQALDTVSHEALVIGPGLGETEGNRTLLLQLLGRSGRPMVIDGGGLNLLARSGEWWHGARRDCVVTPHPGEFARLTGSPVGTSDEERLEGCAGAAERFGQVVVLKGAHTVIASPDGRLVVAPFANAALATAGSGDVLAGLIGALVAQGMTPFDAACLGVYLHGEAGQRISARLGDAGLIASDLPIEIALARRDLAAEGTG